MSDAAGGRSGGSAGGTCLWCNGADGHLRTIEVTATDRLGRDPHPEPVTVHPRHASETRSFLAFAARHGRTFVLGMLALTTVAVAMGGLILTVLDDVGGWLGVAIGAGILGAVLL